MRARIIKPGFFKNDELLECQPLSRILFAGLWCMADREGRLVDRPMRIKIEILPCDNCEVNTLLDELAAKGFIIRYQIEGERYIQIAKFRENQRPHTNEVESEIPEYSDSSQKILSTKVASTSHQGSKHFALDPITLNLDPDPESPPLLGESRARTRKPPAAPAGKGLKTSNLSRLPWDSLPMDLAAWSQTEMGWGPDVTADVWALFRDYWQGKSGKSGMKSDWPATWRTWCRKERITPKGNGSGWKNTPQTESTEDYLERKRREFGLAEGASP